MGSSIHKLCVQAVWNRGLGVSRETTPMNWAFSTAVSTGVHAFYVVFHVKLGRLWITPVDNVHCVVAPTECDGDLRFGGWLNG